MPPIKRDLGVGTKATVQANVIEEYFFVRLEIGGAVGTKYYTDMPTGALGYFPLDLEGGIQNWYETAIDRGTIAESTQNITNVSYIGLDNTLGQFTEWMYSPGLKASCVVTVWQVQFSSGDVVASTQRFRGLVDDGEYDMIAKLTLKPYSSTAWGKPLPWAEFGPVCMYKYRDSLTCQYTGAEPAGETTCGHFRINCDARGNLVHFGGTDLLPKPGTVLKWEGG